MWCGQPKSPLGKVSSAICLEVHENLRKIDEILPNVISPDHLWWKMTPASYDDAMRFVRRQSRISTNSLADGLGIRWSLALDYLEEMKRRGIVGDMQENGWWPVLRKEAFSPPRKSTTASTKKTTAPAQNAPAPPERTEGQTTATPPNPAAHDQVQRLLMEKLHETICALAEEREKNHKLGNNCRLLVAEREAWKHRALAAEARFVIEEDNEASQKRLEALYKAMPDEGLPAGNAPSLPKALNERLLPDLQSK
jgi:hypothetical protein